MEKGVARKTKTYRLLMLLGVALVILQVFSSSVTPQVRASGESPDADEGPHTIPTNGGIYDTLTQVQLVTPTTINTENWTIVYDVRWFMDKAPIDTDGLPLRAVETTPTNITWQAILQKPPSPGNHSFTFRVVWNRFTIVGGVPKWIHGLWMKDYSGSFTIAHAYMYYDFDESLNWNVVSGTWGVLNGSLDGFSNAEGLVYARDVISKNYTVTAKVKVAADSPGVEAAFCFGFVDSANFYWAGLGCWNHRVSISRMVDHVPEELIFSGDGADIAMDVWYIVSIEVSGDTIMLYIDDVLELTIIDPTFGSGVIGIRTWNSHILVDYMTVTYSLPISKPTELWWGVVVSDAGWSSPWGKYFSQAQIDLLKENGVAAVRIMLNKEPWYSGDTNNVLGIPYRDYIKQLVQWCRPELKVILDLTRDGDYFSWQDKRDVIQNSQKRQSWINWGKDVVAHCKPHGIGIMNEPTTAVDFDQFYNEFVVPSIEAYRAVDSGIQVFVMQAAPPYKFEGRDIIDLPYVHIEFHIYYDPHSKYRSAHDWELDYENGNLETAKEKLWKWLDTKIGSIPKNKIFLGEVGVRMGNGETAPSLPNWDAFLRDMYNYAAQNHLAGLTQYGFTKRYYLMLNPPHYATWTTYGEFWAQNNP